MSLSRASRHRPTVDIPDASKRNSKAPALGAGGCGFDSRQVRQFEDAAQVIQPLSSSRCIARRGVASGSARQPGKEVRVLQKNQESQVEAITKSLAVASSTLAQLAGELADHATPVGLVTKDPSLDVPTALARGSPILLNKSGVSAAVALGDSSMPVARAAPVTADALAAFAPVSAR